MKIAIVGILVLGFCLYEVGAQTAEHPASNQAEWIQAKPAEWKCTAQTDKDGHWKLCDGATLDDVMKSMERQRDEYDTCGKWGNFILDQNGSPMYRRMNPPCPKNPPKGPKNYSICDLMRIGLESIPKAARARTLENPAAPEPWTHEELIGFCKNR